MTKQQMWKQLDDKTKDFIKAMTKAGITLESIENKGKRWVR